MYSVQLAAKHTLYSYYFNIITYGIWKRSGNVLNGIMMTSWNGYIFRVTGILCGEFTGHRWIPLAKASDAEL